MGAVEVVAMTEDEPDAVTGGVCGPMIDELVALAVGDDALPRCAEAAHHTLAKATVEGVRGRIQLHELRRWFVRHAGETPAAEHIRP